MPESAKTLPGRWMYDMKSDNIGTIAEYRARWVICGNLNHQKVGIYFD